MPSLLAAPTRSRFLPPMVAVNSVGVVPKSGSPADWLDTGVVHDPRIARSLARSSTIDGASAPAVLHECGVPVVTQTVPALESTVGDPQIPPPMHPLGTMMAVWRMLPVAASKAMSLPCTSGQSPYDATPM